MFYAAMVMKESHNNGPIDTGDNGYAVAGELPTELPKEIVERLEALQRQLGRLEGRLELTRDLETTLREQLEHERERADASKQSSEKRKPRYTLWRPHYITPAGDGLSASLG